MENVENKKNNKNAKHKRLTVIGYVLLVLAFLIVAPVACPPVFGYHTYTVSSDSTGLVSKTSLVYAKASNNYQPGEIVAIDNLDGDRDVDVDYVTSGDDSTLTLEGGKTVELAQVLGRVAAKTPVWGILSQLCFSVVGIIVTILIFVAGAALTIWANKLARKNEEDEDEKEA